MWILKLAMSIRTDDSMILIAITPDEYCSNNNGHEETTERKRQWRWAIAMMTTATTRTTPIVRKKKRRCKNNNNYKSQKSITESTIDNFIEMRICVLVLDVVLGAISPRFFFLFLMLILITFEFQSELKEKWWNLLHMTLVVFFLAFLFLSLGTKHTRWKCASGTSFRSISQIVANGWDLPSHPYRIFLVRCGFLLSLCLLRPSVPLSCRMLQPEFNRQQNDRL